MLAKTPVDKLTSSTYISLEIEVRIQSSMGMTHYILATAGHVDHGKSSLVRALTGTDPDRLPEEKARGITIDLGFAHLDLPAPPSEGSNRILRLGIVDVPGHEDFVTNMVAGVGSIDIALLVVAADDGWMPQTEEHLQILSYLGISRGIVALTKIDLAQSEEAAMTQIRLKLLGSPLANAPIVATSVVNGRGIEQIKSTLAQELAGISPQRDLGKPRLAVDRAFTLRGVGTVVTGTLTGGVLRRGESVAIQPRSKSAKIRTVQSYNSEVQQATPGSRVALNLPDLQAGNDGHGAAAVGRGEVVTLAGLGQASDTIDVLLEMSPRLPEARPLKDATRVRFHLGSGNFPAHVHLHGSPSLLPGGRSLAQLRFESSVFAFAGDRFILRDWPEQQTLAGGVVLDPDAQRRGFRTEQRRQFLQPRADYPADPSVFVASELARDGIVQRSSRLVKSRFDAAQIDAALQQLVTEKKAIAQGEFFADASWWHNLRRKALAAIDANHIAHPEHPGLRLTDLRQTLLKQTDWAPVFDALVRELCERGCVKAGVAIRRASHSPALPPSLQPAGAKIRAALKAKPLEPPSRRELAPDSLAQQALRFLLQAGEAVEVGDDLILQAGAYAQAVEAIRAHIGSHGGATVSELRQVLNTSRRIMVPLLEKLDRDGITKRQGDKRVLRPPR
jgi:selenocysteine-specific elongation factor